MKAQRIRITEKGWETYSDTLCGIKFEQGLSVDPVAPQVYTQIGTILRCDLADDGEQAGMGNVLKKSNKTKAEVKKTLNDQAAEDRKNSTGEKTVQPRVLVADAYTREALEAIADEHGIAGLREVAEKFGVKGRGIVELIGEILKAQG